MKLSEEVITWNEPVEKFRLKTLFSASVSLSEMVFFFGENDWSDLEASLKDSRHRNEINLSAEKFSVTFPSWKPLMEPRGGLLKLPLSCSRSEAFFQWKARSLEMNSKFFFSVKHNGHEQKNCIKYSFPQIMASFAANNCSSCSIFHVGWQKGA